ncbi:pheromone A receptor-domain-containing protein [Mycena amicta]|nr:pheromone A receptor-domain-containing protein [Mycena amicta]
MAFSALFSFFAVIGVLLMVACFLVLDLCMPSTRFLHAARWLIAWIALSCFNEALALVSDTTHPGTGVLVACDVFIRIRMAVNIGVPAALLAITRRIYSSMLTDLAAAGSGSFVQPETAAQIRRSKLVDSLTCFLPVFPYILLQLATSLPTHRRFTILETVGCVQSPKHSYATYFLGFGPVAVVSCAAWVLALVTFGLGFARRGDLRKAIVSPSDRSMLTRLVLLSICILPLSFTSVVLSAVTTASLNARSQSHTFIPGVAQLSLDDWAGNTTLVASVEFARGMQPALAMLVIVLLGNRRAMEAYVFFAGRLIRLDFAGLRHYAPEVEPRLPQDNRIPQHKKPHVRKGKGKIRDLEIRMVPTKEETGSYWEAIELSGRDPYYDSASNVPGQPLRTTYMPPARPRHDQPEAGPSQPAPGQPRELAITPEDVYARRNKALPGPPRERNLTAAFAERF